MSPLRLNSKYVPEILLIVLLVLILLVFRSFHNTLLLSDSRSVSGWAILLLVLIGIVGILFHIIILSSYNHSQVLTNEIITLERRIEESKVEKEVKKEKIDKEKIDIEKEVKTLIPSNNDDLVKFGETLLLNISHRFPVAQGLFYLKDTKGIFSFRSGYAYYSESEPVTYREGETLAGQVAKNKKVLNLDKIPDNYIAVMSGLGKGTPNYLLIVPVISPANETIGIVELASFKSFNSEVEELFAYLGHKLGERLDQPSKP